MAKKIINEQEAQTIINRALALTPNTKGLWGKMTVEEMLYHCNKANSSILQATIYEKKATLKQTIIKIIGLKIITKFPKGVKISSKLLKAEGKHLDFEKEKKHFIYLITQFANRKDPIYGKHPKFGPLKTKEWKRFVWMHMDHHLRQFGV